MSSTETAFLDAIRANPADELCRLVFADWLDENADPRSQFIRLRHELLNVGPDHIQRFAAECELSKLRKGHDPEWLAVVEPERAHLCRPYSDREGPRVGCDCPGLNYCTDQKRALSFHLEPQDTECDAWKCLCDEVDSARIDGREEFSPLACLSPDQLRFIITLPPSIGDLKAVKSLVLYGSCLVCIPPQIGEMTGLANSSRTPRIACTGIRTRWHTASGCETVA